jgi:small-conductance mechanosensitive channel
MKERLILAFENYWDSIIEKVPELSVGIILLLLFLFIGIFTRRIIENRLNTKIKDRLLLSFIGRSVLLVFTIIGIIIFLNQIGLGTAAGGLLAGAGVTALVFGFAFKDIGENFIAGFFLAFSRPFSIGDIIEVNGFMGKVQNMTFRNSHIRTYNGRDIFIPNSMMIKNPLINYTKDGLMRHDFEVGLDYGEDVAEAIAVIMKTLKARPTIMQEKELAPFVIIDQFGTSTINLKIFFWLNTFDMLGSFTVLRSDVMQSVIRDLIKEGFNLPADIIELKIYQEGQPIPIAVRDLTEESIKTKK